MPLVEAGIPDFDLTGWLSLNVPSGVPTEVLDKLVSASRNVVTSESYLNSLDKLGFEPLDMSYAETESYMKPEFDKWGKIARVAGARVD